MNINALKVMIELTHPCRYCYCIMKKISLLKGANIAPFLCAIAVDEALCHPYLASLHEINDEPVCPAPFSFDFEQPSLTEEDIKEIIWRESLKFNPDPIH